MRKMMPTAGWVAPIFNTADSEGGRTLTENGREKRHLGKGLSVVAHAVAGVVQSNIENPQ